MRRLISVVFVASLLAVLGVAGLAMVRLGRAQIEAGVYRERLETLSQNYGVLRERYDLLVKETAVTELVVQDARLSVSIRTATGEIERVETPFDPASEIYVDYIVRGGRLWIRRVFDAATAPDEGVVIDPSLAELDWEDDPELAHGKAAYRALGEGRWVVTATGDGSLGLARTVPGEHVTLSPPPRIEQRPAVSDEAGDVLGQMEALELARAAYGWLRGPH